MKTFKAKQASHLATLMVAGAGLLLVLSACENSKHAEIMSTEDLLARTHLATGPDTRTETKTVNAQSGIPFEGRSIDPELQGLTEPLVSAPELPPSPASPPGEEIGSGPGVSSIDEPAKAVVHAKAPAPADGPAGEPEVAPANDGPAPAEGPAGEPEVASVNDRTMPADGPAGEPEVAPVSDGPMPAEGLVTEPMSVSEETIFAEKTSANPEMEIANLEPSDFVSEGPAPEPQGRRVETVVASELVDVFFDVDQYAIRSAAVPVLEKNAELLKRTYMNAGVLIEGHCDERGTGEYNLALGKRRAQAVKEYLVALGIEASRIHVASYGKEKPFCTEASPGCWQQNRRGHFVQRVLLSSSSQGE